jgi:hypothetical protein
VYTLRSGLALEIYRLTTPEGEQEEQEIGWQNLRRTLDPVLRGDVTVDDLLKRRGRIMGSVRPPSAKPEPVCITNA